MMNRAFIFHCRINPGVDNLQNKETICIYHGGVGQLAFQICITFINQRGGYFCRRDGGKDVLPQPTTFSEISAVGILITHSLEVFNVLNE